jgi:heptosyltransferase-2
MPVSQEDRAAAREKARTLGIREDDKVVGLNLGGGALFAHKMWGEAQCVEFLRRLRERVDCKALLFGAARERRKMDAILASGQREVASAGLDNTLKQFQALVGLCDVLVGGDSLGMHMAVAERVPQVVLFGPTCPQEIELYGRGEKIVSPLDCGPCYRRDCRRSPTCMERIDIVEVVAAVARQLEIGAER